MPTTILVAPSATGKTEHCIHRIRQLQRDQPLTPAWAVPTASSIEGFKTDHALEGQGIKLAGVEVKQY